VSAGDVPVTMEYVIDDNNKLAVVPVDIVKTVVQRIIGNGAGTGITVTSSEHVNSPLLAIALARITMPRARGEGVTADETRLYNFLNGCACGKRYKHETIILQAESSYYRAWIDTKAAKRVGISAALQRIVDLTRTMLDDDPTLTTPLALAVKLYTSTMATRATMMYLTKLNGMNLGTINVRRPSEQKDIAWLYDDDDEKKNDDNDVRVRAALRLVGSATTDENDAIARLATAARATLVTDHPNLLPATISANLSDRAVLLLKYTTYHKKFPTAIYKLPVTINTTPLVKWGGKTKFLLPIGSHWSDVKKMKCSGHINDVLILCNSLGAWSDGRANLFKAYFNGKKKAEFNFDASTGNLISRK
jgi:hypothetical protein